MTDSAVLKVSIWTNGRRKLPADDSELAEALAPHLGHVAGLAEQGYQAGDICDEKFAGWWTIERSA
mgnify:CR=1 FL=1